MSTADKLNPTERLPAQAAAIPTTIVVAATFAGGAPAAHPRVQAASVVTADKWCLLHETRRSGVSRQAGTCVGSMPTAPSMR